MLHKMLFFLHIPFVRKKTNNNIKVTSRVETNSHLESFLVNSVPCQQTYLQISENLRFTDLNIPAD